MKTFETMTRSIRTLGAAMLCAAALAACSSEDNVIEEQPVQPTEPKVYRMTIQAAKTTGDEANSRVATRGLSLDGKTLNVHWNEGEKVVVRQDGETLGTLTATPDPTDPTKATLTGDLDEIDPEEDIEFHLHSSDYNYSQQSGVLLSKDGANSIEENFDHAYCEVTAASGKIKYSEEVDEDYPEELYYCFVTIDGGITLESEQAIVKFTLVDKADGTTPVNAKRLEVIGDLDIFNGFNIIVEPVSPTNVLYVAIASEDLEPDYHLKAITATGDIYTYDREDVTFLCGKYYEVRVQMTKREAATVDLSTLSSNYTAYNGDVLTGTLSGSYKISIADGATVTLKDVTINGFDSESYDWAGITCEGDATIVLEGENSVRGFYRFQPGISVPVGKTLSIRGDGSLTAQSNNAQNPGKSYFGAGIGGRINKDCGSIRIEGGTVTAIGHKTSAGIGSSHEHSCGDITITGGTVTATGGDGAAGIGSGYDCYQETCGNITITGGTVTATGGDSAAGIGCGQDSDWGNITISSPAKVTATKGSNSPCSVGLGRNTIVGTPTCGTITIGGTVYYDGSAYASTEMEEVLKAATFTWPAE